VGEFGSPDDIPDPFQQVLVCACVGEVDAISFGFGQWHVGFS
jgi:hypothetical protein